MRFAKTTAPLDGFFGLLAFAIIALALLSGGVGFYRHKAQQIGVDQHRVIAAIGLLKSGQIQSWRKERLADASATARKSFFRREVREFLRNPNNPKLRAELQERLQISKKGDIYQSSLLIGVQGGLVGQVLLHTERSAAPIDPPTRQAIAQAVASAEPVFSDFFGPTSGSTQIDVVAAVRDADGQPLAAVVLRSSADAFLFPMIQDWPLPSHSAETMLVLRAGSDALTPHRLRHQAATAPRWRPPLTNAALPSVQAVLGRQGRFEGLDYRGKAVFADLRAIPESPWFLISKLDRDEALAQLRFEALLIGAITAVSILLAGIGIGYFFRQRQASTFKALYEAERRKLDAERSLATSETQLKLALSSEKQAEEALLSSEAYFRTIFEQAAVGVATVEAETGRFVRINQRFCDLLGYSQQELPQLDWELLTHPDDRQTEHVIRKQLRDGELRESSFEKRFLRKDGITVWVMLSLSPIEVPGAKYQFNSAVAVDITERKSAELLLRQSEEKWRSLFAILPVGVSLLGDDHSLVEFNPALAKILDIAPERLQSRAYLNRTYVRQDGSLLPPEEQPSRRAVREQKAIAAVEIGVQKEDGQLLWIEVCAAPLRLPNLSCVIVTTDINERKRAAEQQRHSQAALLQAQKMESLGRLAGGVAHDMNNVLAAILSLSSAQKNSLPADSPLVHIFATISTACVRGGSLVKGLLRFARNDLAEERELHLNTLVREEIQLLEHTTLARIRLVQELAEDLLPICGDPGALSHALINLCVNAVDAMPDGGILTLRTRNVGLKVELEVEDNGIGMTEAVLERALEPFFTTKPQGKGTGLGLPMVYATVKAHRGELTIRSAPGKGTCVGLVFPAAVPMPSKSSLRLATSPALPMTPKRLMVLLVDDDALVSECTSLLLGVLGHRTTVVSSGEAALSQIESGLRPDVVILDQNMPGMGGAATVPQLRALLPLVPIVISTGLVAESTIALVETYPGVTLLSKPYSMEDLHQHLESLGLLPQESASAVVSFVA